MGTLIRANRGAAQPTQRAFFISYQRRFVEIRVLLPGALPSNAQFLYLIIRMKKKIINGIVLFSSFFQGIVGSEGLAAIIHRVALTQIIFR